MIRITYSNFSKILNKTFVNVKEVKSLEDFRLFALSMNMDYKVISQEFI